MAAFNIENISSQRGRIAIVTGANVGLGYETTLALAKKDIRVIMACRNVAKAEKAKAKIRSQVPTAQLDIHQVDLSKMDSVRAFAKSYIAQYDRLDLLINNAGVMIPPHTLTDDGFELQMGVNYLSHFLLTALLMDLLLQTPDSRIVTLSSIAHKKGSINFEDLHGKKSYDEWAAYRQSKLACLIFTYELQRRLEDRSTNTISVAAHPGVSNTNLGTYLPWYIKLIAPIFIPFFTHSPKKAAEPTLYAALGSDVNGGDYFGPDGKNEMTGRATKVNSTPQSKDEALAKKLWEVSEQLTGAKFFENADRSTAGTD
ncbi:MAG: oxidoreductase [Bacteroidota bacterium]